MQGVHYYRNAKPGDPIPGIMHVDLGGYHIRDVEFVAAFDVDKNKVGKDLADAIYAKPNNTYRFADVPKSGVKVSRGMTHDGIGKYLSKVITKAPGETADIVKILRDTKTDVVVSYLPVGSEEATKWYVEQVLEAGCAFINCIPVFIGREPYWQKRFAAKGLPIVGDDIKSQVGATITHRVLTRLFMDRGVRLDRTYQLNFGGNTDFLNMLERERLESKKISKTNAVTSMLDYPLDPDDVHVGPSDYVPWLLDRKWCYIRMEGTTFGDVPLNVGGEARGLGLAQQRGRRHRRDPLLQARPRPRPRRHDRGAVGVLHEVAAAPDPRRQGARGRRGVHQGHRSDHARGDGLVRPRAPLHDGLLYWSWRVAALLVQRLPKRLVYGGAVARRRDRLSPVAAAGARSPRTTSRSSSESPPEHPEVARVARRAFRNFAQVPDRDHALPVDGSGRARTSS